MAHYEVHYRDPYGTLLEVFHAFDRLEFARKENEVGVMSLVVPRTVSKSVLRPDARLEIWRTVGNRTYLAGNTQWFLEDWEITREAMTLTAYDANYLLDSRIVSYAAGSAQASGTTIAIDDLMKQIVVDTLTTDTSSDQDISAYLSVDPVFTLAPETNKEFSRRNVLTVLQELAAESRERGTYLTFDVEYVDSDTLCFKTYTGQRGINHGRSSNNPVIISENNKSLEEAKYTEAHYAERTFVYAGGQGTEAARMIETAEDTTRSLRSPFGRREYWVDARMASTSDCVLTEAKAALEGANAVQQLTGRIVDTDGLQWGIHYDYGDIVVAEFEEYSFDAHIDTLHVTVEGGQEILDNRVTGYL